VSTQEKQGLPATTSFVSLSAKKKSASNQTTNDWPVHSFRTLVGDLATLVMNTVQLVSPEESIPMAHQPTELQSKTFKPLAVRLNERVSIIVTLK